VTRDYEIAYDEQKAEFSCRKEEQRTQVSFPSAVQIRPLCLSLISES